MKVIPPPWSQLSDAALEKAEFKTAFETAYVTNSKLFVAEEKTEAPEEQK